MTETVAGAEWIYYAKKKLVIAREMTEPFEIETREGLMKGQAGDYWVRNADDLGGPGWPVKKEIFEKTYRLAHAIEIHEWTEQENRVYRKKQAAERYAVGSQRLPDGPCHCQSSPPMGLGEDGIHCRYCGGLVQR